MSVEKTQQIFADLIDTPQLTVNLLNRPPFKFIVDIVSSVIAKTEYLKETFSPEDLKNAATDKTTKLEFLNKLLESLDTVELEKVKPTKIIAGKDPELTNLMLQVLGANAGRFLSQTNEKKLKSKRKKSEGTDSKKSKRKRSKKEEKESKNVKKNTQNTEDEKQLVETKDKTKKKSKSEKSKNMKKENTKPSKINFPDDSTTKINEGETETVVPNQYDEKNEIIYNNEQKLNDDAMNNESKLMDFEEQTTVGKNIPDQEEFGPIGRPQTSMGRPGTAFSRSAPPKIKKKQLETTEKDSSKNTENMEIIYEMNNTDNNKRDEFDDDSFIIENNEENPSPQNTMEIGDYEGGGALVKKIMNTKNEIEESSNKQSSPIIENIEYQSDKLGAVRNKMQHLTKTVYPLARIFEYINDDIESMMKEFEKWRSEQRKYEIEEQNKTAAGHGGSGRLLNTFINLEKEINEVKNELSSTRGRILKTEEKINFLISNI